MSEETNPLNKIEGEPVMPLDNENIEEEYTSPYCPVCDACGEDGCCSAMSCQQHPDGHYCKTYLRDLKFGYRMYKELMRLIEDDKKYKEQVDKIWDETYDGIYK